MASAVVKLFVSLVVIVAASCAKTRGDNKCRYRCVPAQNCPEVKRLNGNEQSWFEENSCDKPQGDEFTFLPGFSPIAKGDYVCCRDYEETTKNNDGSITFKEPGKRLPRSVKLVDEAKENETNLKHKNNIEKYERTYAVSHQRLKPRQERDDSLTSTTQNPYFLPRDKNPAYDQNGRPNFRRNNNIRSKDPWLIQNQHQSPNFDVNNSPIFQLNPRHNPDLLHIQNQNPLPETLFPNFGDDIEPPERPIVNPNFVEHINHITPTPNTYYMNDFTQNFNSVNDNPNIHPAFIRNPYFLGNRPVLNQMPKIGDDIPNDRPSMTPVGQNPTERSNRQQNARPVAVAQCQDYSAFPADPRSGCCGIESTKADIITEQPLSTTHTQDTASAPNPRFVTSRSTASWMQNDGIPDLSTGPRFKRSNGSNDMVTIDNRISGGSATELGQFPWTLLLQVTFDMGDKEVVVACGASLISSRYVLTAAHCLTEEDGKLRDVQVSLSEYDKRSFPRDCISTIAGKRCITNMVIPAESIIRHPEYDDKRLRNDIALLRLREPAPYTDNIRPICLPTINIDRPALDNLPLSVAGWGRNGSAESHIKQSAVMHLVPREECRRRHYRTLSPTHMCAAGSAGEDSCKGDSGGPLMTLFEGRYYVSGVVSGKRADSPCGTPVPSLYTNVYLYRDWILNNIRD